MTTGARLKKDRRYLKLIIRGLFATTIWFALGLGVGWYQGNNGGFRRGVLMMSELVITMLDKKKNASTDIRPKKYWDL